MKGFLRLKIKEIIIVLIFCGSAAGFLIFGRGHGSDGTSNQTSEQDRQALDNLAAAFGISLVSSSTPAQFDGTTKSANCAIDGPYPDHACTPGAVFADKTTDDVCQNGYSKTIRNVSVATKKKVYKEYGIAYPQATGSYEADHFIPLELGGSNDIANLFPEAASPTPGFHEKDIVEDYLHQEACAGIIGLGEAQALIADDWVKVYAAIPAAEIAAIKAKFKIY